MASSHPTIGIDYTAAVHQSAGIGRYVRELTRALAALHPEADWRLFAAGAQRGDLLPLPAGCVAAPARLSERTLARLWHRLRLPIPVERWTGRLDLFHATDFTLPPTRRATRTVLTIHDLSFERYPDQTMPGMLDYLKQVVPRSVRRAAAVIAVSEATRQEIVALYGTPAEKITAVPHGVDPRFAPQAAPGEAIRAKYRLPAESPLVLTVGTMQPRKNHLGLVRAWARVEAAGTLVIAGGKGWAYDAVYEEVARLGIAERVIFAGYVDDADLPALYRTADVFAFPALYEGFGLPVLEAMACGTPVVTSNVSSLPEVAGEAALLVDPLDVDALAAAIAHLLGDTALRGSLRAKGLARAQAFSWQRAAAQVWEVYTRLLAG